MASRSQALTANGGDSSDDLTPTRTLPPQGGGDWRQAVRRMGVPIDSLVSLLEVHDLAPEERLDSLH